MPNKSKEEQEALRIQELTTNARICNRCKQTKPLEEFKKDSRRRNGRDFTCKTCHNQDYSKNIENYKKRATDKYYKNREECLAYAKQRAVTKKDEIAAYLKEYAVKNKERLKDYKNDWDRNKRLVDSAWKLSNNMSRAIHHSIKSRKAGRSWETLVNYSLPELIVHLESKFYMNPWTREKMTWQNQGRGRDKWNIDHVIPLKYKLPNGEFYFNQDELADPTSDTFKCAWALSNLQPKWSLENIAKSNKFIG